MERKPVDVNQAQRVFSPMPGGKAPTRVPPLQRRLRLIMWLALAFFLFSVIFIIPVGRVPLLRNIAWLMGFSREATGSISFGRALLTWVSDENGRTFAGSWDGLAGRSGETSIFNSARLPDFNPSGPVSGLFDIRQVNAARRALGLGPEGLTGAYARGEEEDANRAVSGPDGQASRRATQSGASGEYYFGTDAELAARAAAQDRPGKGSADTAKLLPSGTGVSGAAGMDWLDMATDKAFLLENSQLEESLQNASGGSVALSNISGTVTAGQKPKRDLANIWLMSKAADRAKYLMLKKQLAAAGYLAMSVPKKVYDSSGQGAGVRLDGNEMLALAKETNQQLLDEEQCRNIAVGANNTLLAKSQEAGTYISALRNVPKRCGDDMAGWSQNLRAVKTNCQEVKEVYENMQTFCGTKVVSGSGTCDAARLDSYESSYNEICAGYDMLTDEEKAERDARLDAVSAYVEDDVLDTFNTSGSGASNKFFPESEL